MALEATEFTAFNKLGTSGKGSANRRCSTNGRYCYSQSPEENKYSGNDEICFDIEEQIRYSIGILDLEKKCNVFIMASSSHFHREVLLGILPELFVRHLPSVTL